MKKVIVAGGSGAIGAAIAEAFLKNGDSVAVSYHSNRAAAQRLCGDFGGCSMHHADFADVASTTAFAQSAIDRLGGVDVLVNCAGMAFYGLLTDMTAEQWDAMMQVNLRSAFLLCKAAVPKMVAKQNGAILNISSMWGQTGASCEVAYSAAKGGLIALTKALAKELGPSHITVNCIAPGVIEGGMSQALSAETLAALAEEAPLMRNGLPQDVAEAALYLASAGFVTGQVLGVNGGMVI